MDQFGVPIERKQLDPPPLKELAECLRARMGQHFDRVSITVDECPDLRQKPWNLAAEGLGGHPRIADVGGQPNLTPLPSLDKKYALLRIAEMMELPSRGFIIGAAAGPFHVIGMNSELMPNLSYDGQGVRNQTWYGRVLEDGTSKCELLSSTECALMANLFGCDGDVGKVLKITARSRTSDLNFTTAIRDSLKARYGERTVSMGGVFLIKSGRAKLHVMPDFSPSPLITDSEKLAWLRFYDCDAPLVCLSVLHSNDPGLDLRIEHTHCFSEHGQGGHYHFDTTPESVEYEAYFNVAGEIYRIDRP
jgi:Domain of Unknown Function (DUF1907)